MRSFLLVLFISIQVMAQQQLPFSSIPKAPEKVTAGTTLARMVQGVGFRYHWATHELKEDDLKYRPTPEAQSALETLQHIYSLALVIKNTTVNETNVRPETERFDDYTTLRKETLKLLEEATENLLHASAADIAKMEVVFERQGKRSHFPIWNLINGPIEDVIYHTGQIVSFRRTSGNPIPKGVNVFLGTKN
jgi:hypothetical protein